MMFRRRSPEVAVNGERLLVGLDLNATRVRAVTGEAGVPQPLALDGTDGELAMDLRLEDLQQVVGRSGGALCRRLYSLTLSRSGPSGCVPGSNGCSTRLPSAASATVAAIRVNAPTPSKPFTISSTSP